MNLSKNVRKDFLIMLLAFSIVELSRVTDENEAGLVSVDNKHHKYDKRIKRRIEVIRDKLNKNIIEVYRANGKKLVNWVSTTARKKMDKVIIEISKKDLNLEYLALNILFINFCDFREHTLIENMQWIRDDAAYIEDTLDLLNKTNVANLEEQSFDDAQYIIETLKNDSITSIENPFSLLGIKISA